MRKAAARAMKGRYWYQGPVGLAIDVHAAASLRERHGVLRYQSGVMDTLDGSHGRTFTFLPVVYEDDCQVDVVGAEWDDHDGDAWYEVKVAFL